MRYQLGVVAVAGLVALAGCRSSDGGAAEAEALTKEISVQDLAALHQQGAVKIYDANTDDYRAEHGKIPGAVLLASSTQYDLKLLPEEKDAKVAFYCSSRL